MSTDTILPDAFPTSYFDDVDPIECLIQQPDGSGMWTECPERIRTNLYNKCLILLGVLLMSVVGYSYYHDSQKYSATKIYLTILFILIVLVGYSYNRFGRKLNEYWFYCSLGLILVIFTIFYTL
jgi:uncharacterized membrane protein SirB2